MNLKALKSEHLLIELKTLVLRERELTTQVLHYLREIESRRLHLERGFSSLFAFCTESLGYSADQAQRRISAMRVLKEIPEVEAKIVSGSLNLTTLAQAGSFFRQEAKSQKPLSLERKIEVLKSIEGKSIRETERELIKLNPSVLPQERQRVLTETKTQVTLILEQSTLDKLERLKNFMSHKLPGASLGQLIDAMADEDIRKYEKLLGATKVKVSRHSERSEESPTLDDGGNFMKTFSRAAVGSTKVKSRRPPVHIVRAVYQKARGCCEFVDPLSQKVCRSRYRLEIEHHLPWAKGGTHSLSNLRLYCKAHNLHRAVQEFGEWRQRVPHRVHGDSSLPSE